MACAARHPQPGAVVARGPPRALIQIATGSGKTFTAISAVYPLIKFGGARRVLFLVDRANHGRGALKVFQSFSTPDDGRTFTELYNVQHLRSNTIDPVARVCMTTIRQLSSMLQGEPDLDPALEERSGFDTAADLVRALMPVHYNARATISGARCRNTSMRLSSASPPRPPIGPSAS